MASKFVPVTDHNTLFDLWSTGLLYRNDRGLSHCPYFESPGTQETIDNHRKQCLEDWSVGIGLQSHHQYGYVVED